MSQLEILSKNQVELTIEVSKEQFNEAIKKVYPEATKDVKVDGFRPGKIPMNIFISRFGYEPLYQDAINEVINETYVLAVREHHIEVVDYPEIDLDVKNVTHEKGFTYKAKVFVMPEVDLVKYTGLTFELMNKKVTKKEVEAEIQKQLENHSEYVIKDGASENGDTVVIDFDGYVDDQPFEGGKAENYELVLGSGSFVPGFEDQLIGLKEGAEVDVHVTFPKNYHAELASKDATFKVKVHEVKTKVVPTLDEEFVKELEIKDVHTIDEYQNHIEATLKDQKAKSAEEDFQQKLFQALVENNPIDVPEKMIENYAEEIKNRYVEQAKQYNIPFEMFLQFQGLDEKAFNERTKIQAANQIKLDLIIEAVMKKENFQVKPKAIEDEFAKLAEENKMTIEHVKEHVQPSDIEYHLKRNAAIEFLKKNNGKEKTPKEKK